jgi:hypothetical protein
MEYINKLYEAEAARFGAQFHFTAAGYELIAQKIIGTLGTAANAK